MAIYCQEGKQHIASRSHYPLRMDVRIVLERKLRALMDAPGSKYPDRKLLARAAGVSERSVGYMLQKSGNPTLKTIQAVAHVFGLEAWELLMDSDSARDQLLGRIFGPTERWKPGDPDRRRPPTGTGLGRNPKSLI